VLHELNLDVRRASSSRCWGPSGSGKSTILIIVAGAIQPTTGAVYLDDVDVTEVPARERGPRHGVPDYALMPHMTVFDDATWPSLP